jgi:hypothetical protein
MREIQRCVGGGTGRTACPCTHHHTPSHSPTAEATRLCRRRAGWVWPGRGAADRDHQRGGAQPQNVRCSSPLPAASRRGVQHSAAAASSVHLQRLLLSTAATPAPSLRDRPWPNHCCLTRRVTVATRRVASRQQQHYRTAVAHRSQSDDVTTTWVTEFHWSITIPHPPPPPPTTSRPCLCCSRCRWIWRRLWWCPEGQTRNGCGGGVGRRVAVVTARCLCGGAWPPLRCRLRPCL